MKITKTTLLFIATLFFLALPMFISGNAQAATAAYNWTGAQHIADGGWTAPADNGYCFGAVASDPSGTPAHNVGGVQTDADAYCRSIAPAWVGQLSQTDCTNLNYEWHQHGTSPGSCINKWVDDTSAAAVAGQGAHECLYCHDGGHASNKVRYLRSAHANATRKVDGYAWVTPIEEGSTAYTASSGHAINWSTSMIDISGTPTPMYWMFGSWLEGAADSAHIIYSGESSGAAWVGCNRCHATGFEADATADTNLEPYRSFGSSFSLSDGVKAADFSGTTQNWAGWQQWGITCSRCHDAQGGSHANGAAADANTQLNGIGFPALPLNTSDVSTDPTAGAAQAAVCYQCHYQNDSKDLRDSRVTNPGTQLVDGGSAVVERHANGYLNSPHAMFTGTYGQLADTTAYLSGFVTEKGTCAGCHNVHDSVTDNAADAQPWNNECGLDCHSQDPNNKYGKPLSAIQHPTGPGTPFQPGGYGTATATVTNPVIACETCHMPGGLHLFRINPDPSYSTSTGGTYLNAIPDPNNNNFPSVYVDLDLACGQCHGGGDASTVTTAKATAQAHGAPYFTKTELAPYAEVMHGGSGSSAPTGKLFSWTNDSSNSYVVNFTVGGAACTEGGCTYTWNFGDGSATLKGPAVSHDYSTTTAGAPVNVTVTVSNGGTNTQIVTPTAVHTAPTCSGFTPVVTGMGLSISGGVTGTSDTAPGVYVNWGDGSPLSTGGTGDTFNHTYIWANSHVGYKVTEIVQDNEGFNCVNTAYVKIGNGGASATTGDVTINVTSGVKTSYYFKQGGLTKVSGSFTDAQVAAGSAAVTVPTGTYDLYLYFATGHTCDYTQGSSATTGGSVNVTCTTP